MSRSPTEYLDSLLKLPKLYGAQIAPNGLWAAWMWVGAGPEMDVYAAPTDSSAGPVSLTQGYNSQNSWLISWTPDASAVIVAQDHDGDERFRLFRVNLSQPGVMLPLTEERPYYFLRGGMLHPNRRWLVYGANADLEAQREIEPTWVYRHDLITGERIVLARPQKACYTRPRLNPQGTHILYERKDRHPSGSQVWLVDIEGKEDREILNFGDSMKASARWLPDGRRVIVEAETETHFRVGLWDMQSETLQWLVDDPDRMIESAVVPFGSQHAIIVETENARAKASLFDLASGTEAALAVGEGSLIPLAPAANGSWCGLYYSAQYPMDIVRFSLDDIRPQSFTSLTHIWDYTDLRPEDFAAAEDFRWRSADGLEIQGWLYRARGRARGTIVQVHGGPTAHSENAVYFENQFFALQGFNVLDPNYRGSTGFSRAYLEAIKADGWGGREQDDIRAGIEALIAAGIAEPGKVGITGTSYGGYSSWCAITRLPPDLVAASAPICGMTDLVIDYETTRPDLRPYSEEMMGGTPVTVPERFFRASPINFVENIRGRLLIVQGLQDPNVTPENVRAVRERLDRAGVEYQVLVFDDEGHGIDRPKNQRTLCLRLAEFFAEAFGGV